MEEEEEEKNKRNKNNWKHRVLLERIFQTNPYPNLPLRTQLGQMLNMTPRKVQVSFFIII
jgi:hypothetical protein